MGLVARVYVEEDEEEEQEEEGGAFSEGTLPKLLSLFMIRSILWKRVYWT